MAKKKKKKKTEEIVEINENVVVEEVVSDNVEIVESVENVEIEQNENPFIPAPKGKLYGTFDENHKLVLKNQVEAFEEGLPAVEFETGYDGCLYEKGYAPEKPAPTKEEQVAKRKEVYAYAIDPITAHIQRLRDETPVDEEKINALIEERAQKVKEIKQMFPYPDGE